MAQSRHNRWPPFKCTVGWVLTSVYACVTAIAAKIRDMFSAPGSSLLSLRSYFIVPSANYFLSVTIDYLTFSRLSYKLIHTACILLCLAPFTQHNVFEIQVCCCRYQCFVFFFNCLYFIVSRGL